MHHLPHLDRFLNDKGEFELASPKVITKRLLLVWSVVALISGTGYSINQALEKREERYEYVLEKESEETIDRSSFRLSYNGSTTTYNVSFTIDWRTTHIIDSELYFYLQNIDIQEDISITRHRYSRIENGEEGLILSEKHNARTTISFEWLEREFRIR